MGGIGVVELTIICGGLLIVAAAAAAYFIMRNRENEFLEAVCI